MDTKTLIICVLVAITLFLVGAAIVQYTKGELPYKDLFSDWKGWAVVAVALLGGGGTWYYFEKYSK
jgi:hypothetical protein